MSTWQEKAREKAEWAIHGYWCQESNCDVALAEDFEDSAERALADAIVAALAPVVEAEVRRGRAEAWGDVRVALYRAWDDGNALGLDGWIGPERGEEPDDHAIRRRAQHVEHAADAIEAGDPR